METKTAHRGARSIFLLCFLAYTVGYITRHHFETCISPMCADGILTDAFTGVILASFKIAYGAGQLVNGLLGTRISPKYMIATGLIGAGAANILAGCAPNATVLLICWILNGYFQSMLWAPIIRAFAEWMPDSNSTYKAGIHISVAIPAGTVLAYLLPALVFTFNPTGWRIVFILCGTLPLAAGILWLGGMQALSGYISALPDAVSKDSTQKEKKKVPILSLLGLIFGGGLIFVVISAFFNGALRDSVTDWVPRLFSGLYGLSSSDSAFLSILIPIISVSGSYIAAFLDQKLFRNEMLTGASMFLLSLVSLLLLLCTIQLSGIPGALISTLLIAITISLMWGANIMFLTLIPYHFKEGGMASAVSGFLDACVYFSAAISTWMYGLILQGSSTPNRLITVWIGVAVGGLLCSTVGGIFWRKRLKKEKLQTEGNI